MTNSVPSAATFTAPTECEGSSEERQSVPTAKSVQDRPTVVPRIVVALARAAVSPTAVTRVRRAVFGPSYSAALFS